MPSRCGEALFFALPAVISRSGIDSAEETQPEERFRRARRRCPARGGGEAGRGKKFEEKFFARLLRHQKRFYAVAFFPERSFTPGFYAIRRFYA